MKTWHLFSAMIKADFLERTRRTSFLITVCMIICLGYAVNTGQIFIKLETYRGIYNSAWVGSLMSLVITFFLGIAGFYLVKNAIERDERTGVGQIIATTPLSRPQYLLGKWLSNFAVLSALVGILALGAVLMQLIYSEDANIHLWSLFAPFLFIALPMMALVAAFALVFETIPWLKGGFGNLVYFGVFISLFMGGIFLTDLPWLDVTGVSLVGASMKAAARAAFPGYGDSLTLSMASSAPVDTFVWMGVDWTIGLIWQRLSWLLVSIGLALLSSFFFNRFDPNQRSIWRKKSKDIQNAPVIETFSSPNPDGKTKQLSSLTGTHGFHVNFFRLVWLEVLLLIKGLKWYWLAGMLLLWLGCITAEDAASRQLFFMLSALWPILVWSKLGEREVRCHTEQLVYQSAYPLFRLLASSWLGGILITTVALSGVLIGRIAAGEPLGLLTWVLSVLFIPTLAITLGIWSRSSKLFEVIYAILWYLGPFNRENGLVVLDYMGIHAQAPVNTVPLLVAVGLGALFALAILGRKRQMIMEIF